MMMLMNENVVMLMNENGRGQKSRKSKLRVVILVYCRVRLQILLCVENWNFDFRSEITGFRITVFTVKITLFEYPYLLLLIHYLPQYGAFHLDET